MNPASEDMKDALLADSGLGLVFGTDLFVGPMPDGTDTCVGVFDTGGFDEEANYTYERPTIQVRSRGDVDGYRTAMIRAQDIKEVLRAVSNETLNSTRYVQVWPQGDIIYAGRDEKSRPIFTVNFRIHRTN